MSASIWKAARRALALAALLLWAGVAAAKGPLYLWELRDADGALRAWLFGTIHVCDAACFPLPPDVRAALASADSLALELDPEDAQLGPQLAQAGMLPADRRLDDALPAELRPRLAAAVARVGLPGETMQRFQPWMASTVLTVRAAQLAGFGTDQGVDLWLARSARAQGLPLWALESAARQIEALAAGGDAAQRAGLVEVVELIEQDSGKAYFGAMLAAWRGGKVAEIDRLMREEASSAEMAPLLAEVLDKRNQEMADAIVSRLASGKRPFVAVGAGHFGGPGGLLAVLAGRGFSLRQVEAQTD